MRQNLNLSLIIFLYFSFGLKPILSQEHAVTCVEHEVNFDVGDINLAGNLTIPNSKGPHPAVVLISGSFADNRDAEAYGFKPFQLISEHLSNNRIAVLRYDDRGVGKSTGKHTYQYTIDELADDVFSAINFLKNRDDINPDQIGLIGHSLGGMIAPLVASKTKEVAFVISLAGPVTKTDEINLKYRKETLDKQGKTKQEIEEALDIEKRIIEVTRSGKGYEGLISDIKTIAKSDFEKLDEARKKRYDSFENYFRSTWYGLMLPFINTPFMKSFYDYKSLPPLENVTCPALFLFGEKDDQIKIHESGSIIITALYKAENYNYTIRVIPNVGHFFVKDLSKKEFGPGFLNIMTNWILENVHIHDRIGYSSCA